MQLGPGPRAHSHRQRQNGPHRLGVSFLHQLFGVMSVNNAEQQNPAGSRRRMHVG
jgi:hypothetical protein